MATSPGISATLPRTSGSEAARLQDAFRLDFSTTSDDELTRRLDKLRGETVRVVRTSGNPREQEGTLKDVDKDKITLDPSRAIPRIKIERVEIAAGSLAGRSSKSIDVSARTIGDVRYSYSAKPWSLHYQVDVSQRTFRAFATIENSSAMHWNGVVVDLWSGPAFFRLTDVTLAPGEVGEFDVRPCDPGTATPDSWNVAPSPYSMLVFDASQQSPNESANIMLELSSRSEREKWLIDGPVTVLFNRAVVVASLPKVESRLRGTAAGAWKFRYIKLASEPFVTVDYQGPSDVFGEIAKLKDHQVEIHLGRLTTYTVKFEPNRPQVGVPSIIQVIPRTEPGWKLSDASKVLTLSDTATSAEALAVNGDIDLTFDTRIVDSDTVAGLRAMARRYPSQNMARELLDQLHGRAQTSGVRRPFPHSPRLERENHFGTREIVDP